MASASMQLHNRTRDELETLLEPYRTIDGYRIANITEVWFSEIYYYHLMLTAWSLDDGKLTNELSDALGNHWIVPRMTNVGPTTRNLHLATIAAIRGDRDEALSYLDSAYRGSFDPAYFRVLARRFDVRGEWSDLLTDPRYLDLVARSDKMRAGVRARVQAEMPLLLSPDLDLLQKSIPQDRPTG